MHTIKKMSCSFPKKVKDIHFPTHDAWRRTATDENQTEWQ